MINKIKYLFCLILCAGLIGGLTHTLFAQNGDQILTAGKKPLKQSEVNTLIEFYEWAFEAAFTDEQREKFQNYTRDEFRNNPDLSRRTIDDIVTTFPKIQAAAEDVRQETRRNFLKVFLEEARQNTDENSKMLLEIYEEAHGGNQTNTSSTGSNIEQREADNSASLPPVGNISELVGEWNWGRTGSMTTTTSGVYLGGNASRHTYQFSPNGAVVYTGIMNVMTGGCRMQIFKTAKGRAALNGTTLTINWAPASFSRDDSCSPSKNYKKTLPAETETFKVNFKDSYGQKQLCLTGKDETCFSKN